MSAASQAETTSLIESYDAWREACSKVETAYRNWEGALPSEQEAAFGGYLAALQLEQHTAHLYQRRLELLREVA